MALLDELVQSVCQGNAQRASTVQLIIRHFRDLGRSKTSGYWSALMYLTLSEIPVEK